MIQAHDAFQESFDSFCLQLHDCLDRDFPQVHQEFRRWLLREWDRREDQHSLNIEDELRIASEQGTLS